MDPTRQTELEARLRQLHGSGDLRAAATVALGGYGAEIFGLMVSLLSSDQDADEAFADFAEDLWVGLGGFQWRSSFRTWAYVLARNAVHRLRSRPERGQRALRLSASPEVASLEALVRSVTQPFLRTEVKSELSRLRESLDPEDQLLLILRLDKGLSWREIAAVYEGPEACPGAELDRCAATLRKRFQVLKDELRQRARQSGLLSDDA